MEYNYDDIVLLERYLDLSLNDAERAQVESRLKVDPGFKELYEQEKTIVKGIRFSHLKNQLAYLDDLESRLPALDAGANDTKVISLKQYWKPLALAASVLLVGASLFFFVQQRTPLNERLYLSYFEPFDSPGSGLTRGGNVQVTVKRSAYEAYDNGNYVRAAQLFEQALNEKDEAIVHLCLGNAYMKNNQWEKAESTFLQMLKEHNDLVTQAKWYLALVYIKENKVEKAKSTLWEITTSSTYKEKAKRLLEELN